MGRQPLIINGNPAIDMCCTW